MSVTGSVMAAAGLAGAGISAIGANSAANAGENAANNAAGLQAQTANNSLNFDKLQYGNSLQLLSPYINSGTANLSALNYLMGVSPQTGLPQGVVNPNAPQVSPNGASFNGSKPQPGVNGTSSIGGSNFLPAQAQGGMVPPVGPANATAQSATVPTSNSLSNLNTISGSPVNAGTAQVPGSTSGLPNFNQIGGTGPINTGQFSLNGPNPGTPANPGSPSATGSTGQPLSGTGALVPALPQGAAQPGTPDPNANGAFGSLGQQIPSTFTAPDAVTEQNDPGYKFRLDQGTQILNNSAAAKGGLLSGGTAKALMDYGQNDASNEFQNVYNRSLNTFNTNFNAQSAAQTNQFNRFAAMAGLGQTSANQLSGAGLQTANAVGNTLLGAGQQIGQNINNAGAAQGSGYVGVGNALGGGLTGAANSLSTMALLQQLQGGGGGNPNAGMGVY